MNEIVALFDIASDGVTGSLVAFTKNKPPLIIYSHKEVIAFPKSDTARAAKMTINALKTSFELLEKEGCKNASQGIHPKDITTIHCFFASPWFLSQTRSIKLKRPDSFTVTEQLVRDLVATERKVFLDEMKSGVEVVEETILSASLNGYATATPYKKNAREVEISLYVSVISKTLHQSVRDTLEKHYGKHRAIFFHTFPLALFSTMRDAHTQYSNFLTVDIASEVTDIGIVKNDVLAQVVTVPLGRNHFVNALADKFSGSAAHGLSLLQLYSEQKADMNTTQIIAETLKEAEVTWLGVIQESLAEHATDLFVPDTMFIAVEASLEHYFENLLSALQLNRFQQQSSNPLVIPINHALVDGFCDIKEKCPDDPVTSIEAVFINRKNH